MKGPCWRSDCRTTCCYPAVCLEPDTPTPVPSEADPGVGERCICGPFQPPHNAECPFSSYEHRPTTLGLPFQTFETVRVEPSVADPLPATPDAGEVEALAKVIERAENPLDDGSPVSTYGELARAVLASDWLAAQKAAARAEEREALVVLDGLLHRWETVPALRRATAAAEVRRALGEHLARIAREAR